MKIADYSLSDIQQLLGNQGLVFGLDPFVLNLKSDVEQLAKDVRLLYADFEVSADTGFADFHVEILREKGLRRWFNPLVRFFFDGQPSFIPLPRQQVTAMLEWGLNWCVAAHAHHYLVIHAAVVEKNGVAMVLPAPPGSGKSTLCAALTLSGWRLLSDELALLEPETGRIYGMARPISLKNQSIDIVKKNFPYSVMTASMEETSKGTVALLKPPLASVLRRAQAVAPRLVISPQYDGDSTMALEPMSKAHMLMLIAGQSFNFDILGAHGFNAITHLLDHAQCYQLRFAQLDTAIECLDRLAESIAQ